MAAAAKAGEATLRHAFGNVLSLFILLLIGVLAFSIRLFSVRSPIMEFFRSDPNKRNLISLLSFAAQKWRNNIWRNWSC